MGGSARIVRWRMPFSFCLPHLRVLELQAASLHSAVNSCWARWPLGAVVLWREVSILGNVTVPSRLLGGLDRSRTEDGGGGVSQIRLRSHGASELAWLTASSSHTPAPHHSCCITAACVRVSAYQRGDQISL